jgi:hypothetical protein
MASREALFDELQKIAEEAPQPSPRLKKLKKALKNAGLVALGYGTGELAGHLTHKGLSMALGDKYKNWSTPTKKRLIGMGLGLTGAATVAASMNMLKRTQEAQQDE